VALFFATHDREGASRCDLARVPFFHLDAGQGFKRIESFKPANAERRKRIMNATKPLSMVAAVAIFLSGCCLKFNDLAPDTTYNVGSTIATGGKTVKVEQFQWANGTWSSTGHAKVDSVGYAGGSGSELRANNVNFNFQLDYPLSKLTFKFADYGGNENIKVNNDFRNVSNFLGLNNTTIGGVNVTVTAVQNVSSIRGEMVLQGPINGFTVGGQEFWIDEVCPTE
jgi:hypothetical protein